MVSEVLIAFTGPAGCGKTTAAKYLVWQHGFVRVRFADPLKRMLAVLGLSESELDGDAKERPSEILCGQTPRWAMQSLGTEWGRDCISNDLWTHAWKRECERIGGDIVVDDCRFQNEADVIAKDGGLIVRIIGRATKIAGDHISEHGEIPARVLITNDGTLEDMQKQIDDLMRDLSWVRA